ncbi:MAG: helicase [Elusimicrobia bacterium]|nr:helicase [Elusimicrobiota bacterium]
MSALGMLQVPPAVDTPIPSGVGFLGPRDEYLAFLDAKSQLGTFDGFEPSYVPDFLFDFQRALVMWAVRKGKAAIFADCGLGKTPMQLVWAENVRRHTNRPVLIVTPLAVSAQTIEEGAKFGIEVRRSNDGTAHAGINVTNYERLHHFSPADFAGTVCDESSAIKSFAGKHRAVVTDFMRKQQYRLLATATAAPNDYIELGTSSEALGQLGYMDMLNRFFKNDQNTSRPNRLWAGGQWRFKGHAEQHFWRWVCSWARALRRPSDLGFDDARFALPPLIEQEHLVQARSLAEGMLFELPAVGLYEERQEQRRTLRERCEKVASLINRTTEPAVAWCHLNAEGDLLAKLIPDAVQVSGSDTVEAKEAAFMGFAHGQIRALVIKPKIGAFGLNWQHCAHMTVFPSHSYEQYYQAVRRCWRFGQTKPVTVDIVTTESGSRVMHNLQRKSAQADTMFTALVGYMNDALAIAGHVDYNRKVQVPAWL